ncbi:MAG: right-handed parallel beta-helix repeat-containing protein [Deltaproteobacteria bacterium]|nr:right-handed parallel beta-helix repeat-containing protein [Deltaproteobacteria bacterium]
MRTWLLAACGLIAAGCMKTSEKYCQLHAAEDPDRCPAPDAPGGGACTGDRDCADLPTTPVCDVAGMTCVGCVTSATCAAPNPTCLPDRTCGRCKAHSDCPSQVCESDGACAGEADVAYVTATGTGSVCSLAMPCGTIDAAARRDRRIIKVTGTISDNPVTLIAPVGTLDIYGAPGTKITRMSQGAIFEIRGNARIRIHDLELTGATGSSTSAHAISMAADNPTLELHHVFLHNNVGLGISATTGTVVMDGCVVADNFGGGASMQGANFAITNSVFAQNGNTNSLTGGVTLGPSTLQRFEFNTVGDNQSSISTSGSRGVNCTGTLPIANNIYSNNRVGLNCTVTYSMFDPLTTVTGTNIEGDPMFRSTDIAAYASSTFYRIAGTSPAKNAADPAATLATDIDGDPRPQDSRRDMGADEFRP